MNTLRLPSSEDDQQKGSNQQACFEEMVPVGLESIMVWAHTESNGVNGYRKRAYEGSQIRRGDFK